MTTIPFRSEAFARDARMLRTALGPAIAGFLEDTGRRVTPADAERIVRLVAHHVGVEVQAGATRVSAELPESGERFEGLLPLP